MPHEPKMKVLSIRATATKAIYWKSQAFARGLSFQTLVADAVEEYITNHELTEEQTAAYKSRFQYLKDQEVKQ